MSEQTAIVTRPERQERARQDIGEPMTFDIISPGYVQKRRRVLTHLQQHKMTLNEYLVFDVLLLLADAATGSNWINATAIQYWTGNQVRLDAADRALRGLERKGYIVREITPGNVGLYLYHVQKFVVTKGAERGTVLTFTKKANVVEKTEELLEYFGAELAEDGAGATAAATAAETRGASAGEGADNTIKETGNGKPETGNMAMKTATAGEPASQPPSEQPKEASESGKKEQPQEPDAALRKLMRHFYKLLGTPAKHKSKGMAWVEQLRKLTAEPDKIQKVMDWAINEDPDWGYYITASTKLDPLEYFVEKFETIETQMDAQEKRLEKVKGKAKKVAAAVAQPKADSHAAKNPELHTGKRADGTNWTDGAIKI